MEKNLARRPRRLVVALAAALALVAAAVVGVVALGGGDGARSTLEPGAPLTGGSALTSCLAFSEDALGLAPIAFDGTVTDISGDRVTLEVERWYRGGTDDTVEVTAPEQIGVALHGAVGFVEGERYLLSGESADGRFQPSVCGFSVVYSEDMAAAFERAFR